MELQYSPVWNRGGDRSYPQFSSAEAVAEYARSRRFYTCSILRGQKLVATWTRTRGIRWLPADDSRDDAE